MNHRLWSWSDERRAAELAKCQVLCQPCHQEKTAKDMGRNPPGTHGRNRYNKGCRCEVCTAASTDYRREMRRRKKP